MFSLDRKDGAFPAAGLDRGSNLTLYALISVLDDYSKLRLSD